MSHSGGDTTHTSREMISKVERGVSEETIDNTLTSIVLKGKICIAVCFVTLRGAGTVLLPDEINLKSRRPVISVL